MVAPHGSCRDTPRPPLRPYAARWLHILASALLLAGVPAAQVAQTSKYRGWDSVLLAKGLIELQVVSEIGGRVMQLKLG